MNNFYARLLFEMNFLVSKLNHHSCLVINVDNIVYLSYCNEYLLPIVLNYQFLTYFQTKVEFSSPHLSFNDVVFSEQQCCFKKPK